MRFFLIFTLALSSLHAGDILQELQQETRLLRPRSSLYKSLKADFEKLSDKDASAILAQLTSSQKKNFFLLFSTSGIRVDRLKFLLTRLKTATPANARLLSYFCSRIYQPNDADIIIEQFKDMPQSSLHWPILASSPSSAAFGYFVRKQQKKPGQIKDDLFLNSVTRNNIGQVLSTPIFTPQLQAALARRLLNLPAKDQTSLVRLKQQLKKVLNDTPKTFSADLVKEILKAYTDIQQLPLTEFIKNPPKNLFKKEFSPDLNWHVRSQISRKNDNVEKMFRARMLNFSRDNFLKYHKLLDGLYAASTQARLQALLKMKDQKDPQLQPVYLYLLKDPFSEIRRDALDALTILAEGPDNHGKKKKDTVPTIKANTILPFLYDPSEDVIIGAILLLTELNDSNANLEIMKLVQHRRQEVKMAAIESIERNKIPDGVPVLLKVLKDEHWNVRARAVKAIKVFRDKNYTAQLEQAYLAESDPYVKNALFEFMSDSTNPKIFKLVKDMVFAEEKINYQLYANFLNMKLITKSDVIKAQKYYNKGDTNFWNAWLNIAKKHAIDSKKENKIMLQRGSGSPLKYAVSEAASFNFNLLTILDDQQFSKVSSSYLLRYYKKATFLSDEERVTFIKRILLDSKRDDRDSLFISLIALLPKKAPKTTSNDGDIFLSRMSGGSELKLSTEQLDKVRKFLEESLAAFVGSEKILVYLFLQKQISDPQYKQWLTDEQISQTAQLQLIKSLSPEQITKYETHVTKALFSARPYGLDAVYNLLSNASLMKIYENSDKYSKPDMLKYLALSMPIKELKKEMQKLKELGGLDDRDLAGIIKKLLRSGKPANLNNGIELMQDLSADSYERSQLNRLIPSTKKLALLKEIRGGKSTLTMATFSLLAPSLNSKDFPHIKKYLSQYQAPQNMDSQMAFLQKPIEDYVKNNPVDAQMVTIINNSSTLFDFKNTQLKNKVANGAVKLPRPIQENAFAWMESIGYKEEVYYEIYKNLLKKPMSPYFDREDHGYNSYSYAGYDDFGRNGKPIKPKAFKARPELVALLKENLKSLENSQDWQVQQKYSKMSGRLGKVTTATDWLNFTATQLKKDADLIEHLPKNKLSEKAFILLRQTVQLKLIDSSTLQQIATALPKETKQKLIAEYRKTKNMFLLPLIYTSLTKLDADILAPRVLNYIEIYGQDYNSSNSFSMSMSYTEQQYFQKLRQKPLFFKAVEVKLASLPISTKELFYLAVLKFKMTPTKFNKIIKNKLSFKEAEEVLQASYITGIITAEILKLHTSLLKTSQGKELIQLVKLSPDFTAITQLKNARNRSNSFGSSQGAQTKRQRFLSDSLEYDYYDRRKVKKNIFIPDSLGREHQELIKAKKAAVITLKDMTLNKYISTAGLSFKDIISSLYKNPVAEITLAQAVAINRKLKKSDRQTFQLFIKYLIDKKPVILNPQALTLMSTATDEQHELIRKFAFSTGKSVTKKPFAIIHLSKIKDQAKASEFIKAYLKTDLDLNPQDLRQAIDDRAIVKHFQTAGNLLFEQDKTLTVSTTNLPFLIGLGLKNDRVNTYVDQQLSKFDKTLKHQAIRFLLSQGPYFKNAFIELKKLMDSSIATNPRQFLYEDIYFLFQENFKKIDSARMAKVQAEIDEVLKLKRKIYAQQKDKQYLLLAMYLDKEFILKEFPKAFAEKRIVINDIYLTAQFDEPQREKYLKYFVDNFGDDNYSLHRYFFPRKLKYKWLPKKFSKKMDQSEY